MIRHRLEEGARFGRLTALISIIKKRHPHYICVCDCGESKCIAKSSLISGDTKSCGCIQKETGPWNKGLTGIGTGRPGPRPWFVPAHKLPVGSETIRRDKGNGSPRVYRKVAEPNIWRLRAVLVWEELNGPAPNGCVVHHKDRDSMNDIPTNLECLTRSEHAKEHAKDQQMALAKSGIKYVYPNRKGWMVAMRVDGISRHFGTYPTIEEAASVAHKVRQRIE